MAVADIRILRWTGASPAAITPAPTPFTSGGFANRFDITSPYSGQPSPASPYGNTRANAVDPTTAVQAANDTASPVQIPSTGGVSYSVWVSTRLYAATAPNGTISNINWYTSGANFGGATGSIQLFGSTAGGSSFGTGGYVGCTGSYSNPSAGTSTQLTQAINSLLDTQPSSTNLFNYYAGGPLLSVSGSIAYNTGNYSNGTGDFGAFVIYQLYVNPNATAGPSGTVTFTWRYDEN